MAVCVCVCVLCAGKEVMRTSILKFFVLLISLQKLTYCTDCVGEFFFLPVICFKKVK